MKTILHTTTHEGKTNAEQLREIMADNNLKAKDVSKLIDVSIDAVRSWLIHSGAPKHRPMKNRNLDYLRLKLQK